MGNACGLGLMKFTGTYESDDLKVVFVADGILYDYGVSNSPAWYEPDPNTIEIVSCHIAGTKVNVSELPKNLQESIRKLSEWVDFSNDY